MNSEYSSYDDGGTSLSVSSRQDSFEDLDAYNNLEKPVEKSVQQIYQEAIDTSPMMSVSQIRALFSGKGPLFPRQGYSNKKDIGNGNASYEYDVQDQGLISENQQFQTDNNIMNANDDGVDVSTTQTGLQMETENLDGSLDDKDKHEDSESSRRLTTEEFIEMAKFHDCYDAVTFYKNPCKINIIIKKNNRRNILKKNTISKEMELQFNPEQRLLMMLRDRFVRYIRLSDLTEVDARPNCIEYAGHLTLPHDIKEGYPLALHFNTTDIPMIIVNNSEIAKNHLLKLIKLLHRLLKTSAPLNVIE